MNKTQINNLIALSHKLSSFGFSTTEIVFLVKSASFLSRWNAKMSDGALKNDPTTGGILKVTSADSQSVQNRETGFLNRIAKMMESHPGWGIYHSRLSSEASLWVYDKTQVEGMNIAEVYSSVGLPIKV